MEGGGASLGKTTTFAPGDESGGAGAAVASGRKGGSDGEGAGTTAGGAGAGDDGAVAGGAAGAGRDGEGCAAASALASSTEAVTRLTVRARRARPTSVPAAPPPGALASVDGAERAEGRDGRAER